MSKPASVTTANNVSIASYASPQLSGVVRPGGTRKAGWPFHPQFGKLIIVTNFTLGNCCRIVCM